MFRRVSVGLAALTLGVIGLAPSQALAGERECGREGYRGGRQEHRGGYHGPRYSGVRAEAPHRYGGGWRPRFERNEPCHRPPPVCHKPPPVCHKPPACDKPRHGSGIVIVVKL